MDLAALFARVPEGYSVVSYAGRRYGVTKTLHAAGRSIKVLAEELGGTDLVSANLYRTDAADLFRPCEMPEEKVLAFLRGWTTPRAQ